MAKKSAVKTIKVAKVWSDQQWTVRFGKLNPGPGHPPLVRPLFTVIGEKLPFEAIGKVRSHLALLTSCSTELRATGGKDCK